MQNDIAAPRGGLDTRGLLALISRLSGTSLSPTTLDRWVQHGLVTPSLARSRTRGRSHRWSAGDVVLVAWLARLRADGVEVLAYRGALRASWRRLAADLGREIPLFLTATAGRMTSVLTAEQLAAHLRAPSRSVIVVWPAIPLRQVREEAALLGVTDLR